MFHFTVNIGMEKVTNALKIKLRRKIFSHKIYISIVAFGARTKKSYSF